MLGLLGKRLIDSRPGVVITAHETLSCVWLRIPKYCAVIVVVPQETAVARPLLLIVAIATLLDAHEATLVRSSFVVAGEYTPSAINCVVSPT
jgi:hypothetical protein